MDPEVDASAGCAWPPGAYFFSWAQPEDTPVPEAPSPLPRPSPPAAMLVTLGTAPLVLVAGALGSAEMLEMADELVDCWALLLESASV